MSQQGNITALGDPAGAAVDAAFLGSTSAPPTLVFKPGVTFSNNGPVRQNVFTSPNSSGTDGLVLLQDILQGQGFFPTVPVYSSQIEFDFSSNSDAFVLTANLNLGANCTVKGIVDQTNGVVPTLSTSTFTIVPLLEIKNLNLIAQATSGSTFTATPGSITFSGQTTITSSTGFPLYTIASGVSVTVLRDTATLGDGTHPVVNVTGGTLNIIMFDGSALEAGAINRAGGAVVIDSYSPGASIDSSYVGAAGFTINLHYSSSGTYSPAVPANWSPDPTLVTGALDQIAAQIHITPGILVLGGTTNVTDSSVGSIVAGSSSHASNVSVAMGNTASATGNHSVAIGPGNVASSVAGVAIGDTNLSEGGSGTVAIGGINSATGIGVVALGTACTSTSIGSAAIGSSNTADDNGTGGAVAIGESNTIAASDGSLAIGYSNTIAPNVGGNIALGYANSVTGSTGGSVAIGNGNTAVNAGITIGSANTVTNGGGSGDICIGTGVAVSDAGVGGTVGIGSFITATGDGAVAIGSSCEALTNGGPGNIALGYSVVSEDSGSGGAVAIGTNVGASGDGAVAIGLNVNVESNSAGALAVGEYCIATTSGSLALGYNSNTTGSLVGGSIAIGYQCVANDASGSLGNGGGVAIGYFCEADSSIGVAIGSGCFAQGQYAPSGPGPGGIAIGSNITADSEASIVTGENGSSYFVGESVHHSGNPGLAPTPQTTADRDLRMIPMSGNLAAGSAPGSTLVLTLTDGSSQFDLNRFSTTAPGGATLAIRVECTVDVAYGDPTQISAWFKQTALVRTGASSAPVLVGTDTQTSIKDAGAATWTMTLGLSGDVFTVTLSNGSATNGFSATARLTYDPNPNFYV